MSKYFSKKVTVDGLTFDSKHEAERWMELQALQKAGLISNLERQVKFELIPSQRIDGRVVERALTYTADFVYLPKDAIVPVVEDAKPRGKDGKIPAYYKSTAAWREYVIKRKLMLYLKGIKVLEV